MNSISQEMRFRLSLIKYADKAETAALHFPVKMITGHGH